GRDPCEALSVARCLVGPPFRRWQADNMPLTNLTEDPRKVLLVHHRRAGGSAWADPRMHDPALASAIVGSPKAASIRADVFHDAPQGILDFLVDRRFRTGRERLREIRQQGLELQAFRKAPLSATTLPALDEQRDDEPALDEQQADGTDDVASIQFPH